MAGVGYRRINALHTVPTYLLMKLDSHLKYIVTRFIFGVSDINIHRLRYRQFKNNNLVCPLCEKSCEREVHFILQCHVLTNFINELIPIEYHRDPSLFKRTLLVQLPVAWRCECWYCMVFWLFLINLDPINKFSLVARKKSLGELHQFAYFKMAVA